MGSPAKAFHTVIFPIWPVLMTAFGLGVRRCGSFPMTSRMDIVQGGTTAANDVGHLAMTAATITFVLSQIGFSAAEFGWRFRVYAIIAPWLLWMAWRSC